MSNRLQAAEFYNQGCVAAADKTQPAHLQHAYQLFSSSVFVDPTFGLGWYGLANANNDLKMYEASIAAYRRALRCDLDRDLRAKTLMNLGWSLWTVGQITEANERINDGLLLDPESAHGWLTAGCIEATLNRRLPAIAAMRRAVKYAPDDPVARMGLAFRLLESGNYEEGFTEFEIRYKYKLHQFLQYPYPKWLGEPDKTLFLVADQGLGDTLSFARFVPMAAKRCKFIHMVVQPELMRAFSQAFIDLPNINIIPLSSPFLPADAWSTFVSLPFAMQLTNQQIMDTPQITLPQYSHATSWMVPHIECHIGLAWAGSPLNDIDKHRSIPVTQFLELYRVPGVQLYSLQVGERAKDLETTGSIALIRNLAPYIHDITDTVSLLRDLDLVICCESALGHICSSINKEAWIPYSYLGRDWRAESGLWNDMHTFYKQGPDLSWGPVFDRIIHDLKGRLYDGS